MRRVAPIAIICVAMLAVSASAQRGMRGGMGPIARPVPGFRGAPVRVPMAGGPRVMPMPRMVAPMPGGTVRIVTPRGMRMVRRGGFGFGRQQDFFLNFRSCDPFRFVSCRFLFFSRFHHRFFSPFFFSPFAFGATPFFGGGFPLFWPDYQQAAPQYIEVPTPQPIVIEQPQPEPAPQPAPPPQPTAKPQPEPELPPTVLVFRDQHREEIRNYAIVDTTLYVFQPDGRRKKISLSDLDLAATEKVNDERGVEFRVPAHKS